MVIYINVANDMDRQEIKTRTVRKDDMWKDDKMTR